MGNQWTMPGLEGKMSSHKMKGQGQGAASKLTDKEVKERKMPGHSHLSKDNSIATRKLVLLEYTPVHTPG